MAIAFLGALCTRTQESIMTDITAEQAAFSDNHLQAAADKLPHFDISSALQTSLEFDELIQIFCSKIQTLIPHNSVEYINTQFGLNFKRGVVGRHVCKYELQIENCQLGNLSFTRSQRFSKNELGILEALLCCLVYPLKNATLYHQALQQAYTDPLTKLYNRSAFGNIVPREIQRVRRSKQHLAAVFVDIDFFKTINDEYGHVCGDLTLQSVASRINESIRGADLAFRYGGEEFVMLLTDAHRDEAIIIAERIRENIASQNILYADKAFRITVSLGVSALNENDDLESLINRADKSMYRAKQLGRNRVCSD
jgi:diguanylate cyclase (GGDEF)-like protein